MQYFSSEPSCFEVQKIGMMPYLLLASIVLSFLFIIVTFCALLPFPCRESGRIKNVAV
jgi:hypothetical protein